MFSTFTVQVGKHTRSISIDFIRAGWKQFCRTNAKLGTRFIKSVILKRELAEYIAAHEAAGKKLDTICHELRYDDGLCLLLMRSQGVWYITEVYQTEEATGFEPYFFWQRVKRGASYVLTRVLGSWRTLCAKAEREVSA